MSITVNCSAKFSLHYNKNILLFTFSCLFFFDKENHGNNLPEYLNEDLNNAKKPKIDYKDKARQKKKDRKNKLNEHNEERKRSKRGLTNSTPSDLLKSPNNVNQQYFSLKTAPLYSRVVAPVWDRRVTTPRSLD